MIFPRRTDGRTDEERTADYLVPTDGKSASRNHALAMHAMFDCQSCLFGELVKCYECGLISKMSCVSE